MRKFYLFLIGSFLLTNLFSIAVAQVSTLGKEFWVGYMDNNRVLSQGPNGTSAPDFAVLLITANEATTGFVEYRGVQQTFSLNAGQQYTLRVPSETLDLLHRNSGVIENKGVYISSSGEIAVHAFNERVKSADGTVVLPVSALGKDYYITSHYEVLTVNNNFNGNENDESELLVVATEDATQIEITTSVNTISGNTSNTPFTIQLNRGQSYQLKAEGDLTGSRVRVVGDTAEDCKKIAVFGGNKWTSVGNCGEANDNLFQQAYPVNTWGTSFVHVALSGRTSGELVKVLAAEDNTEVKVNGTSKGMINAGQWMALEFGVDESGKIDTSKPSSVTVFSKSMACNQPNTTFSRVGDPFMITYSPAEQFLTAISFNAISLQSIENHYVNIVVKTGEQNNTLLDGLNIGNRFSALAGDPSFQIARVSITQGVHSLQNPAGFAAYIYGFGEVESYGYAAGAALNNLNFETQSSYEFEVTGEKVACLDSDGLWSITSENPDFIYFTWDFGDGTEQVDGQEVNHVFENPGKYEVKVLAAKSLNSCDEQEEIVFEVEVVETSAALEGEQSVCPEVEEIIYRVTDQVNVFHKVFEVEGGEIVQDYGDSVLVKWGPANDHAKIRVIPYLENGCPGKPFELEVVINQRIEVSPAEGNLEVCFDPSVYHLYRAPNVLQGRGYDWLITGGTIISGQGSAEIEVSWDQPGIEGKVTYTAYSLVDNQCEGTAEAIEVQVLDDFQIQISDVISVACFGGANGSIELDVKGGQAPYTYLWSHDPSLNAAKAVALSSGVYSVEVRDNLGCLKVVENIEITEPDVLSIRSLEVLAISCFGKSDGSVQFQLIGGVPPYQLDKGEIETISSTFSLENLPSGTYQWMIRDASGCELPLDFEILSPVPLEVDVRMEKPACPGGSDGELMAIPRASAGTYWYEWKTLASTDKYVSGLAAGIYEVEITDSNGCISIGSGRVSEQAPIIRMPTGFDPRQGVYEGVVNCEAAYELWVYNRWGQMIYFGTTGWDGTVNGDLAPSGTYTYLARYIFSLEGVASEKKIKGGFTLIR